MPARVLLAHCCRQEVLRSGPAAPRSDGYADPMRTLLSERFAPITTSIGFLRAPLDRVAAEAALWIGAREPNTRTTELRGPLEALLPHLEPLAVGSRPRMLYVEAGGGAWTAYFDCLANGTDPFGPVHTLTRQAGCEGLIVATQPDEYGPRSGRFGSVGFVLVGPGGPEDAVGPLVREVMVMREGTSRFAFHERGEVQPFEDQSAYASRKIRDRLTSHMVEAYCRALGLDPFEASSYGPRAVLLECDAQWYSKEAPRLRSLAEEQARLGIVPGAADSARG